MTTSMQHTCVWLVQVAMPHAKTPPASLPGVPPESDDVASEPLAEASVLPLDAPLLDVLLPVAPLLDVLPDPASVDVPLLEVLLEVPPLDPPLLDVELPEEDVPLPDVEVPEELPLLELPEPPVELDVPPPPSSPPMVELLAPLQATKPNRVPIRATTGSRIIVSSSRAVDSARRRGLRGGRARTVGAASGFVTRTRIACAVVWACARSECPISHRASILV
jgi:hypothetical protein